MWHQNTVSVWVLCQYIVSAYVIYQNIISVYIIYLNTVSAYVIYQNIVSTYNKAEHSICVCNISKDSICVLNILNISWWGVGRVPTKKKTSTRYYLNFPATSTTLHCKMILSTSRVLGEKSTHQAVSLKTIILIKKMANSSLIKLYLFWARYSIRFLCSLHVPPRRYERVYFTPCGKSQIHPFIPKVSLCDHPDSLLYYCTLILFCETQ